MVSCSLIMIDQAPMLANQRPICLVTYDDMAALHTIYDTICQFDVWMSRSAEALMLQISQRHDID